MDRRHSRNAGEALAPVFGTDVSRVFVQVLEMIVLFQHRRLVDVIVSGKAERCVRSAMALTEYAREHRGRIALARPVPV